MAEVSVANYENISGLSTKEQTLLTWYATTFKIFAESVILILDAKDTSKRALAARAAKGYVAVELTRLEWMLAWAEVSISNVILSKKLWALKAEVSSRIEALSGFVGDADQNAGTMPRPPGATDGGYFDDALQTHAWAIIIG